MTSVVRVRNRCCIALLSASALAFITGCGGPYDASVNGIVTLDGQPVPRGTVKFIPQQPGPSGYGWIKGDGSYEIMVGREEGLNSGSYVATVVVNEESTPNANPDMPPTPGKAIAPLWYRSEASSPLRFTVEPGSNEINLDLTSQPPAGWKTARTR